MRIQPRSGDPGIPEGQEIAQRQRHPETGIGQYGTVELHGYRLEYKVRFPHSSEIRPSVSRRKGDDPGWLTVFSGTRFRGFPFSGKGFF
jgi:hypothetical protein